MKGTFKKPFEKEAAEKLATCLEEGGITFETKFWGSGDVVALLRNRRGSGDVVALLRNRSRCRAV
jgi:hypothetical protein